MIEHPTMPPIDPLLDFRMKHLERLTIEQAEHIKQLENSVRENRSYYDKRIQEIKDHYEEQERSRLMWGISSLGSLVMLLVGIVWNYRAVIFKGSS
jgi:hypothetical protein